MSKSQIQAIQRVWWHLQRNAQHNKCADEYKDYAAKITKFLLSSHDWGMSIVAKMELTGLSEFNLLRLAADESWHVFIGPRGGITVMNAPKSYRQFNGRRAFGMLFKLT